MFLKKIQQKIKHFQRLNNCSIKPRTAVTLQQLQLYKYKIIIYTFTGLI